MTNKKFSLVMLAAYIFIMLVSCATRAKVGDIVEGTITTIEVAFMQKHNPNYNSFVAKTMGMFYWEEQYIPERIGKVYFVQPLGRSLPLGYQPRFFLSDYEIEYTYEDIKMGDRVKYQVHSVDNIDSYSNVARNITFIKDESDASKYTVIINGETHGPYDQTELQQMAQQGTLTRETLVWKEGMEQWEAAGMIEELIPIFLAVPPSLPPQSK